MVAFSIHGRQTSVSFILIIFTAPPDEWSSRNVPALFARAQADEHLQDDGCVAVAASASATATDRLHGINRLATDTRRAALHAGKDKITLPAARMPGWRRQDADRL